MIFSILRLHIVEEFNRDIYDYIIASDESVFDAVAASSSILICGLTTESVSVMYNFNSLPALKKLIEMFRFNYN